VAWALLADITGIVAQDDGTGRLTIATDGTGTDEALELLGDYSPLTALGFTSGQLATGTADRIPLVQGVSQYCFEDVVGTDDNHYRIHYYNSTTTASLEDDRTFGAGCPEQQPKGQAESRAPRGLTLLRKQSHVFRNAFFADEAETVPLIPLDASRYPSFQVVDINGQIVQAGLATLDGQPGHYRVEFFVAADAPISNDDRRWRLEWLFVDQNNRQFEKTTEFDVRDVDVTVTPVRDIKLIALCDQPFRLFIREVQRPYSISMNLTNTGGEDALGSTVVWPGSGAIGEELLTEVIDGETYVYYFDVPANTFSAGVTYQAVYQIRKSLASIAEHAFQVIEVPPTVALQYFPALRMCIDKYQKRRNLLQAYQDSDIYEYLTRGLELVNGWHPVTSFQMTSVPGPLVPYWLMAGQLWGLNAQFLLETDLSFDFSGQTVTLNYDHTGNIDTAISRATDFIREGLGPAKTAIYRRQAGVGVSAGRPYRVAGLHNFVYPLSRMSSTDFITLLSNYGLL
jgi:hypothetical protein